MMMFKYASVTMALFFSMSLLSSCTTTSSHKGNGVPAESMKMAGVVYKKFQKLLESEPKDSDFERFVTNPKNYRVFIKEINSGFIYTFGPNYYHGKPVLDGVVTYKVTEDGKVELQGTL